MKGIILPDVWQHEEASEGDNIGSTRRRVKEIILPDVWHHEEVSEGDNIGGYLAARGGE